MRRALGHLALALTLFAGAAALALDRWIDTTDLPPLVVATGTEVLDRDGQLLRAYTTEDGRWRLATTLDNVDPRFIAMLIAYEDKRFRDHRGVDPRALIRAAWQAATTGRIVSGGSTLTMQVARLLEDTGTGTWSGKLRQIRVALALERRLSKDEILTLYLNLAPYGGNIEGLRAASLSWFGTEPARLDAAQSALLIALPQAPAARRPDRHPEAAATARAHVLSRIADRVTLDAAERAWAAAAPLPQARRPFPALAPHLADRARAERSLLGTHRLTLDAGLQARMETLVEEAVTGLPPRTSAAILVLDHQSGELRAAVGSPGYTDTARQGYVDMTTAWRSPGSTLKPLIYGLALDTGLIRPETLLRDAPAAFAGYAPANFDGSYLGELNAARALQLSRNLPAVALLSEIGAPRLLAALRRAGADYRLPDGEVGLAIALGGIGLRLEDLVRLYGAIARGGTAVPWHWRQGAATVPPAPIFGAEAAWMLAEMMAGTAPPPGAPRNGLAYKTGTSYGYRDAWAVGFDGRHVVGVWIGRADGAAGPGTLGAEVAAPVLFDAFARISPALTPRPGPPPGAAILPNAQLPVPLQRFAPGRTAPRTDGPAIAFPPPDAVLAADPSLPLMLRVADGTPPFTWLWNGAPVAIGSHDRELFLDPPGPGFGELTVIDAAGRSAGRAVELALP